MEIQAPRVIVAVLSDTTEAYDRGRKFSYYRACPTVEEYVLVASKYQAAEVYRRTAHSWTYDAYGPGDEIELTSLAIKVSVAALYRDAGVPAVTDEMEDEI
jgi:Uma2 family endonuclease